MLQLFQNQAVDGSSVKKLSDDRDSRDGDSEQRVVVASGVFGGATVTITVSGNGTDFVPLTSNTFTSPLAKSENLPNELFIKAEVTGATGATDISVHVA